MVDTCLKLKYFMLTKKVIKPMPAAYAQFIEAADARDLAQETINAIRASKFEAGFAFPNIPNVDWLFNVLYTLKPDHALFQEMAQKVAQTTTANTPSQQQNNQQQMQQQQQQPPSNAQQPQNKPKNTKTIDIDTIKNKYKTLDDFHEALSKAGFFLPALKSKIMS